jgi:hypothetical protein
MPLMQKRLALKEMFREPWYHMHKNTHPEY